MYISPLSILTTNCYFIHHQSIISKNTDLINRGLLFIKNIGINKIVIPSYDKISR